MKSPVLPMFPLPNFFLFPGAIRPLHVFEPRYRQLVEDLLDRAGRFVVAAVPHQYAGKPLKTPPVFPIGSLVEIVRHDPLEDGRYLIWIVGRARARLEEVPSDRLYRQASVEVLTDIDSDDSERQRLRPQLEEAIHARSGSDVALADDLSIGALADILLQSLKLNPTQLEEVFADLSATRRAERALSWL
jgi:Lon protease-like protein